MTFPQHAMYVCPESNFGKSIIQIGQSSNGGGCLKSLSSCSLAAFSAALLRCSSQSFLCFDLCFFLHAALQYITILHLLHVFVMPLPSLPQLAQILDKPFNVLLLDIMSYVNFLMSILISYLHLDTSIEKHIYYE